MTETTTFAVGASVRVTTSRRGRVAEHGEGVVQAVQTSQRGLWYVVELKAPATPAKAVLKVRAANLEAI